MSTETLNTPPDNAQEHLVIVGGGHAAAQLCASLTERRYLGQITLVSEEAHLPYHRPPLSKTYLKDEQAQGMQLRAATAYTQAGVQLRLQTRVHGIDRASRSLQLDHGQTLAYDKLVLATGARTRQLPTEYGPSCTVRTLDDAAALRARLPTIERIAIVGGGYIGLELALSLHALGKMVLLLEAAPRLLARSASPEVSSHLLATHRAAGIDIMLSVPPSSLAQHVRNFAAEQLIAGIGADAETALAQAAGLACDNGVVVDAALRSITDPHIFAIGDCCNFPLSGAPAGTRRRLESVQNANDQARALALTLTQGHDQTYQATPWFWSEQGSVRLQTAGVADMQRTQRVLRPGRNASEFSVLHYLDGQLCVVESVNAPLDHMAARKLLDLGRSPSPEHACAPDIPLKHWT